MIFFQSNLISITVKLFILSFLTMLLFYLLRVIRIPSHFQIKTQNVDAWISSFGEYTKKQKTTVSFEVTLQCSLYDTIYSDDGVSVALRTITSVCSSNFHGLIKLLLTLCGAKKRLFPHLT